MELVFLPEAQSDLKRLRRFLVNEARDPVAAEKAALAIKAGISRLLENPYMGRSSLHRAEYRELVIPFGRNGYIVRHRVEEKRDAMVIVRVRHSREDR